MTDGMIVDLFFDRNELAISECDTKYGTPLRSFGNRITNDEHTTEECVNDTYMSAWLSVPPKDPRDYLFAYLCRLMRGKCVDHLRAKTSEKRGGGMTMLCDELCESASAPESADSEAIAGELARLIESFLRNEREQVRHIFILRYFYMYEVKDIASRLLITEGKTKTVLKRTRDKLKAFLSLYGWGGEL